MTAPLPRVATRQELAVLLHPDQRSTWTILIAAHLDDSIAMPELERRLDSLHEGVPMVGARVAGGQWIAGSRTSVQQRSAMTDLAQPWDLSREPPLRVAYDDASSQLVLAAHHAAFDGLGLVGVLTSLVATSADIAGRRLISGRGHRRSTVASLIRPADRVSPSTTPALREVTDVVTLTAGELSHSFTGRLVDACVAAVAAHNQRLGRSMRRVGVSLGVAGAGQFDNSASYRRIDVAPGADIEPAVSAALASAREPRELRSPRLVRVARPVFRLLADRLGDTFLVSNLGVVELPGVRRIDFYPVARGPSAVSFGAVAVVDGDSTLTIRARDLNDVDGPALLADVRERFSQPAGR